MSYRKLRPPKISDPPEYVEINWIDAQGDIEEDLPIDKAGGLVELPCAGYYVRHAPKGPHGPFVVIAQEVHRTSDGVWHCRSTTSIPVGWIVRWSVMTGKRQVWPEPPDSPTSTSTTRRATAPASPSAPTT